MGFLNKTPIFLLTIALTSPAGIAGEFPELGWRLDGDAFLRFGEGIETAHTPWARPAANGKIRALILANQNGACDVPELARRLDMDLHGMPADSWLKQGGSYWLGLWIGSSSNSERSAHFEQMLQSDYDVIVLGNFRFLSLSEAIQYQILRKVSGGCGLVMFSRHDLDPRLLREALSEVPEQLARGIPFAGLDYYRNWFMPSYDLMRPGEIGPKLLSAYTFGRGRIVIVDYNQQSSVFASAPGAIVPPLEYDDTAPTRYDYYQSMAARCVQWAAGRDPQFEWTAPLPDGMEIAALAKAPPVHVHAAWSGSSGETFTRRTRVRNLWGESLLDESAKIDAIIGKMDWDVSIPPLPGGWHFVDLMVSSAKGMENWASFAVDVRPGLQINAVEPADTFFESGEPVKGRITLSKAPSSADHATIDISLEDGYGRVFSRKKQPVEAGADRVTFEIPQGHVVSWGARLRVRLLVGDQVVHQKEAQIRLRRSIRGEYPIAMWGAIGGYGNHTGNLQMRKLGINIILGGDPLQPARDDLGSMAFGGGRGVLIHSLGDEIPIPRPGKGEPLNEFLKTRYASIEELNGAWGTHFASWNDVQPIYTATDGDAGSFVRMHDCLSCGENQFAENIRKRREEIEKTNPTGLVGPEGSPVGDPELTLAQATFWGPYLDDRDNLLVNALGRPGVLRGNWFGGYVEDRQVPTRNRHRLWMSILGGNNMIEYFTVDGGLLAPDLTLMPFVQEFLPSWEEIRRGLGPQLATCRPTGHPVALLHSQASEHIGQRSQSEHTGEAGGDATNSIRAHEYMLGLLGDAGYSPQYVASGQIKAGRLDQGDVRVLMLVQAYALSDTEIQRIRDFAERGGTVIADVPPAWFDERCRVRKVRGMDDFFGISPVTPTASLQSQVRRMASAAVLDTPYGPLRLRGAADASAKLTIRPHGKGRSILLDGVLWRDSREDPVTVQTCHRMLQEAAGVKPNFTLVYRKPLNRLGTRVYSYQRGDVHIEGILPPEATDPDIPVQPVLTWPESKHTYDMRSQKYIGNVKQVEMQVERSSPVVVARLDYQVASIEIDGAHSAKVGDELSCKCTLLDTQGRKRTGHVLRVTVVGPDGEERPYYGGMLNGDEPTQSWQIPFALNDKTGKWKIAVTDVISGVSAAVEFELNG